MNSNTITINDLDIDTATNSIHQLHADFDRIAHRIAELGTDAETDRLAEIARAIERVAPAVADALVDPQTPEVSRQRAFAVACTAVRRLSVRTRSTTRTVLVSMAAA